MVGDVGKEKTIVPSASESVSAVQHRPVGIVDVALERNGNVGSSG